MARPSASPFNPDRSIHFVLCDFGKIGQAWVERDAADMDRATTVRDIATGQIENVIKVVEVNLATGWSCDVTEDVAREVFARVQDNCDGCPILLQDFIEQTLGVEALNAARAA